MARESIHPSLVKRVLGICNTPQAEPNCWRIAGGRLVVDLGKAPELAKPGGAVRFEKGRGLSARVLLFRDQDGQLHACENRCAHAGRRLDLNPDDLHLECCSIGGSRFDAQGHRAGGMARKDVRTYPVEEQDGRLIVHV